MRQIPTQHKRAPTMHRGGFRYEMLTMVRAAAYLRFFPNGGMMELGDLYERGG